jgi:2'-5' RNA ligase
MAMTASHPLVPWPTEPGQTRWGVYLRPDPQTARDQAEIHDLLARQFGLHAAGTFMPHATLKGFFRSQADHPTLVAALDLVVRRHAPFEVWNAGVISFGWSSLVLDINRTEQGAVNEPLRALHAEIYDAVAPYVADDCDFTRREAHHESFYAHLTLMMADCPGPLFDEVKEFVMALEPIGSASFIAQWVHLYEFTSADWAGAWWETLHWRLHHSWRLGAVAD